MDRRLWNVTADLSEAKDPYSPVDDRSRGFIAVVCDICVVFSVFMTVVRESGGWFVR